MRSDVEHTGPDDSILAQIAGSQDRVFSGSHSKNGFLKNARRRADLEPPYARSHGKFREKIFFRHPLVNHPTGYIVKIPESNDDLG
jgi:hypothetical protein